jgi:hypothetical protein
MTTDTPTDTDRYCLSIWLPSNARVDTVHATEADARAHLAAEAERLGSSPRRSVPGSRRSVASSIAPH